MGSLNPFKKPKVNIPKTEPVPDVPKQSDTEVGASQEEARRKLSKQRGRAATIFSSRQNTTGDDGTVKKLLGG